MNSHRLNELAVNITERLFDTGAADQEATQNALAFVVAKLKPVFECLESADKDGRKYAILAGTNAARAEKAERERDELLQRMSNAKIEREEEKRLHEEGAFMLCGQYDDLAAAMGWSSKLAERQGVSQLEYARQLNSRVIDLEAEIARRDAAAGEPVAVLYRNGDVLTKAECGEYFEICCKVETPLYTTPPAASVPDVNFDLSKPGTEATVITHYQVPDGWKLVPLKAFPSQWAAGQKAFDAAGINKIDPVYHAMVEAAPAPGGDDGDQS